MAFFGTEGDSMIFDLRNPTEAARLKQRLDEQKPVPQTGLS